MSNDAKWNNNELQFARLIAELEATGAFTDKDMMRDLCASMDLTEQQVGELIDRAQTYWDEMKAMPTFEELEEEGECTGNWMAGEHNEGEERSYDWKGRKFIVTIEENGRSRIHEDIEDEDDEPKKPE